MYQTIYNFFSSGQKQLFAVLAVALVLLAGTILFSILLSSPKQQQQPAAPVYLSSSSSPTPSPLVVVGQVAHAGRQNKQQPASSSTAQTMLALSTASFTPVPTGLTFPPPIPPTGYFIGFDRLDWNNINPECPPFDVDTLDYPLCLNWRNVTDGVTFQKCVREACTNILATGDQVNTSRVQWYLPRAAYQIFAGQPSVYSYMVFSGPKVGPRKLSHEFSDFIRVNIPLSTVPTPSPPALPFMKGLTFINENTPVGSFTDHTLHGVAKLLVFMWNEAAMKSPLMNPAPTYSNVGKDWDRLVFTPGRCFDMALQNIGWLQYNTVTMKDFSGLVRVWFGFNVSWSPHFDPITASSYINSIALGGANVTYFEELCRTSAFPYDIPWIAPLPVQWYCDLFFRAPVYYQWDAFRNPGRVPNLWPDFTVMAAAVNREYRHGAPPLGCLGLPP